MKGKFSTKYFRNDVCKIKMPDACKICFGHKDKVCPIPEFEQIKRFNVNKGKILFYNSCQIHDASDMKCVQ